MKFTKLVAASLLAMAAAPVAVHAQAAATPTLTVGATVYGPQGGEVGTIQSVSSGNVVVNTGTHSATLPAASFVSGEKGPMIGMNKADLDAAIEKAKQQVSANLDSALTPGASVASSDAAGVATIKQVNPDGAIVVTRNGTDIALPKNQFTMGPNGLALVFSTAQLDTALQQNAAKEAALDKVLVADAALITSDGMPAGKIREIDASGNVVIDQDSKSFALPKGQFKVDDQGRLALRFTNAQLQQALGGT
jgi:hypothetical protein